MQLSLGVILYFLAPYFGKISMMSDWMGFYLFFAVGDVISDFFFRESSQKFIKKNLTFILVIPVFAAVQLFYLQHPPAEFGKDVSLYYTDTLAGRIEFLPIVFIGCFSMFVLAFRLQDWNALRFLRVLGYHSLFIYVMHVIVSAFVRIVLMKFVGIHEPVILLFCGIATGVVIPVMIYNLLIKDNIGWFLFSLKKPDRYKKILITSQKIAPKTQEAS
jgi:hypothetical protein